MDIRKEFSDELIGTLIRAAELDNRLNDENLDFVNELFKAMEHLDRDEDIVSLTKAIRVIDNCMDEIEATRL